MYFKLDKKHISTPISGISTSPVLLYLLTEGVNDFFYIDFIFTDRGAVFATPPRSSVDFSEKRKFDERTEISSQDDLDDEEDAPFRSLPFSSYVGHTADVLDLAWSKVSCNT